MFQAYLNAAFAEPPIVLGRRLQPLSLAHLYILTAMQSPFAVGGKADIGALIQAVWVCSRPAWPFPEISASLRDPQLLGKCRKWGKRSHLKKYDSELAVFQEYIATHVTTPPRYDEKLTRGGRNRAPRKIRVPIALAIAWRLMERLPEDRVWTMPLPLAFAYAAAASDALDDDMLIAEDEADMIERLNAEGGTHGDG